MEVGAVDLPGKTLQLEIMDGVDEGVDNGADAWTGPKCDITLYIMYIHNVLPH